MEYKFVFQAVPEQEELFRQVSQGLEKLTEMYSREKLPGLWKVTDRLNRAQEGKAPISSGRRNFRRVMALVDWLLGIFALIPAVQSPRELGTLLAVGAAAFGVGAGMLWVLLPRTLGVLSLLISLPLIMGSLGNPDQLGNLLGLGVLLLLLGLAVLFSKFRRKETPMNGLPGICSAMPGISSGIPRRKHCSSCRRGSAIRYRREWSCRSRGCLIMASWKLWWKQRISG